MEHVVGGEGDASQVGGDDVDTLLLHGAQVKVVDIDKGRNADPEHVPGEVVGFLVCGVRGERLGEEGAQLVEKSTGALAERGLAGGLGEILVGIEGEGVVDDREVVTYVELSGDGDQLSAIAVAKG